MMRRSHLQEKSLSSSSQGHTKRSQFAPRPFAPPVEVHEPPSAESVERAARFGHSFADVDIFPKETVQPKLVLGPVGDKYEQEANRVARRVVETISYPVQDSVQRQEDLEDEDELDLEELEEEAAVQRQMAGVISSSDQGAVQRQENLEDEDELDLEELEEEAAAQRQMAGVISSSDQESVQRQEDLEDEDELDLEEEGEELRRKVAGLAPAAGGADVGPDLESAIHRARSGGQPLSDTVRQPMERAFGADFGGVRVHADGEADSLNRSIQARAFTTGQDIFLRQGEYRPGSSEGQRLLAHELTHVVQQNGGDAVQRAQIRTTERVKPTMRAKSVSTNDDVALERKADVMGEKALQLHPSSSAASEVLGALNAPNGVAGEIGRLKSPSTEPALIQRTVVKKRLSAMERMEKDRKKKEDKQRRWRLNGRDKYKQSKAAIETAVKLLDALPFYDAGRLTKSVTGMNRIWESRFTYEESWINNMGPLVAMVYTELHTMISPKEALRFRHKMMGELRDFAQLLDVARPGQAQQVIGASMDGTYNGRSYHEGTAGDPISIVFYKQEQHYRDIPKEDNSSVIAKNSIKPYSVLGLPSSKVTFPYVGMKLQDIGRSMPRKMNATVRRLLVANEYDLSGTEIDHIHDMGFGGADTTNNLWPLDKDVNQRPNSGGWRTRYLFHYWDSKSSQIKLASVNSPGMAKKYYLVKGFDGMEGTGRNDLPTESGRPDAGTN